MKIFISHIHEEAPLAKVLQDEIERAFMGQVNVFVSSNLENLPAGSRWLDIISDHLSSSKLVLVICSSESLQRPWVNFEVGCAWIKDIPIIPICHSGYKKATLPVPFSEFNALELEAEDFFPNLFQSLVSNRLVNFSKLPTLNYPEMNSRLKVAFKNIPMAGEDIPPKKIVRKNNDALNDIEVDILLAFYEMGTGGRTSKMEVVKLFTEEYDGLSALEVEYYLDSLLRRNFIQWDLSWFNIRVYWLTKKGRDYLISNNLHHLRR